MSRKAVLLVPLLLALALLQPACADTPQAAPPADQQAPTEKPGLMTRFARLFDSFDTTKPENQHVFVIGTHDPAPQAAATGSQQPEGAAAAPVSSASSADSPGSVQATASTSASQPAGHGFKLKSGFGSDDGQAAHPPQ
jgi:hypothetical protein